MRFEPCSLGGYKFSGLIYRFWLRNTPGLGRQQDFGQVMSDPSKGQGEQPANENTERCNK